MLTFRGIFGGVLCLGLCTAAAFAGNWPEFRGPTGQGLSAAKGVPTSWSDTENVAWKVAVPGKGWSSPILWENRLYLTTAVPVNEGDFSLRVLCLDAVTGDPLWDSEAFLQTKAESEKIHGKNSLASPTPLTDGKRLFVHFGTHGTACLDLDGKILWQNTELKYAPVHGNGGSPVLVDGHLVFSCDGGDLQFVVALNAETGKIDWKTDRKAQDAPRKFAFSTPLVIEVAGRRQIVSPGPDAVVSYDPKDGTEIWRVKYSGYSTIPRPVFGHGMVFVVSGYDSPSLLAVRPDGEGDVTETHVTWKVAKAVPHSASLLLVGAELYMVSDRGIATCVNALTGDVHWQERVGGNYSASPTYAEGKVYFQSEEGEGIVVRADTAFEELARNPLGERTLASYAVDEGTFFIRTESKLYRIQAR